VGASSVLREVIIAGPPIVMLMLAILAIHVVITFGAGWLLRFDLRNLGHRQHGLGGRPRFHAGPGHGDEVERPRDPGGHHGDLRLGDRQLLRVRLRVPREISAVTKG